MFVIDAKQDSGEVATWKEYILPSLSDILSPVLVPNYSATLAQQGTSTESAVPTVKIRSLSKQP